MQSFEPEPLTESDIINTSWVPISPAATFKGNGKKIFWKDASITSTSEPIKPITWPNTRDVIIFFMHISVIVISLEACGVVVSQGLDYHVTNLA